MTQQNTSIGTKNTADQLSATEFNDLNNTVNSNANDAQTQLDGKANSSHSHVFGDVTNLQTELDGKEPTQTQASQGEMEAGTETTIRSMSPENVKQAIDALGGSGGATNAISQADSAVTVTDTGWNGRITFKTDNTDRWQVTEGGHIVPQYVTGSRCNLGQASLPVGQLYLSDWGMQWIDFDNGQTAHTLNLDASGNLQWDSQLINIGDQNSILDGDTAVTVTDSGTDGNIEFKTDNTVRWNITSDGHLIPNTNSTFDIGEAENKVRHLYLSDNSLKFVDDSNVEYPLSVSGGALHFNGEPVGGGSTTDIVQFGTLSANSVTISLDEAYHEIDLDSATGNVTIVVDSSDTTYTEGHQSLAKVIQGGTARNVTFTAGTNVQTVDSTVAALSTQIPSAGDYAILKFVQFRNRLCVVNAEYITGAASLPELDLFIIAGQSNASGQADTTALGTSAPTSVQLTGMDSLYYASWHDVTTNAESTQHYSSVSTTTDIEYTTGTPSQSTLVQNQKFGPELGFVYQALADGLTTNQLAVMKYSVDGSALTDALGANTGVSDWDTQFSGTNVGDAWRGFKAALADAIPKFQAEGYTVNIKGMIWWQTVGTSAADLTTFISEVRSHLGTTYGVPNSSEFPIVITETPYQGANLISVSDADDYVGYIDSTNYGQSGANVHVGSGENGQPTDTDTNNINDMLDIGYAYADKMATILAPWTPAQLTGSYWWDASDTSTITESSNLVTSWTDKNQSANLIQNNVANQPDTNTATINSLNVLDFQGSAFLQGPVFGLDQWTKLIVYNFSQSSTNNLISSASGGFDALWELSSGFLKIFQDNSSIITSTSPMTLGKTFLAGATKATNGDAELFIFGDSEGTANAPLGTGILPFEVGSFQGSNALFGQIAEVVLLPSVINLSDRQKAEGYLAHKWGLTADLDAGHPYKNIPPTV